MNETEVAQTAADNWGAIVAAVASVAGGGALWWLRWRKNSSGTDLEVKQNKAAENVLDSLNADNTRLRQQMQDADARADAAEKKERDTYTLLVQCQGELRMAMRDLDRLRKRLQRAGVPDSDWMPHMETTFGELPK